MFQVLNVYVFYNENCSIRYTWQLDTIKTIVYTVSPTKILVFNVSSGTFIYLLSTLILRKIERLLLNIYFTMDSII